MTAVRLVIVCLALAFSTGAGAHRPELYLAATTSTVNSGLLDVLLPRFEARSGYKVKVFPVATGNALRMARSGKVDVLLVHAPEAEQRFIEEGYGLERREIMHNHFILVGPVDDPAQVRASESVNDAMAKIAAHGSAFVSRGDDSGTHKKELKLWRDAGIDPYGAPWYRETGVGMGASLEIANAHSAYTLTDRGTWLALRRHLVLGLLVEDGESMLNPYGVIAVNPKLDGDVNAAAASAFVDWMITREAQRLIGEFRVDGEQLFIPAYDQ